MASDTQRIITLEDQVRRLLATVSAFQGQPSNATLSVPHNDSWIFEDNVDGAGGFSGNLRYVIAKNITRVVSARLSIFMAAYRTYNNFSATTTSAGSAHNHAQGTSSSNTDSVPIGNSNFVAVVKLAGSVLGNDGGITASVVTSGHSHPLGNGGTESAHTHPISVTSTLGITEGAVATGVTVAFDGVDATTALGGPFNADVIELDVRRFLGTTQGVKHTIAMKPSGLGRIEAHLRLGVYVSAGQVL